MKTKKTKTLITLILVIYFMFQNIILADLPELTFSSIRQLGMGGAGVALSFDEHALHKNPAGLIKAERSLRIAGVRAGLNQYIVDNASTFEKIAYTKDLTKRLDYVKKIIGSELGANINVSPLLSYTSEGFGIGAFGKAAITGSAKDRTEPRLELEGAGYGVVKLGIARNIELAGKSFSFGISGGYVHRAELYNDKTGSSTFLQDISNLLEKEEFNPTYFSANGWTCNLGVLTSIETPIGSGNMGIAVNNLISNITEIKPVNNVTQKNEKQLPFTTTIGIGLETKLPDYIPLLSDFAGAFTVAADYRIISPESSLFKNLYMGIEKKILDKRVILRGGLNQGFVVGGLGIDLSILHLNYAYFTEESGSEIGVKPVSYHMLEIGIRI
ncbi:MAG: conjugal transfer protein TraF [bacterium]|nr:conjugal transfer protein TraF [bacterium]